MFPLSQLDLLAALLFKIGFYQLELLAFNGDRVTVQTTEVDRVLDLLLSKIDEAIYDNPEEEEDTKEAASEADTDPTQRWERRGSNRAEEDVVWEVCREGIVRSTAVDEVYVCWNHIILLK